MPRGLAIVCLLEFLAACSTANSQRTSLVNEIRQDASEVPGATSIPSFDRTLEAIASIHREAFVSRAFKRQAYAERPEPIGFGQTISDPYIVAIMTAAADIPPTGTVLEVGTGSGYQAAVLSRLSRKVYTIEIVDPLARLAAARLKRLGFDNVRVRSGDGFGGWPDAAPFDAILVTAGANEPPQRLLDQLAPGGRLVMPIGPSTVQERLIVFRKETGGSITRCVLGSAMFVPLTGRGARRDGLMGLQERGLNYCFGADLGRWEFQLPLKR